MHAGNMDLKGDFGEVSGRNEEHAIANWRKGDSCYKAAKNRLNCICVLVFVESRICEQ